MACNILWLPPGVYFNRNVEGVLPQRDNLPCDLPAVRAERAEVYTGLLALFALLPAQRDAVGAFAYPSLRERGNPSACLIVERKLNVSRFRKVEAQDRLREVALLQIEQ